MQVWPYFSIVVVQQSTMTPLSSAHLRLPEWEIKNMLMFSEENERSEKEGARNEIQFKIYTPKL
jgi:hypothetical protein